MISINKQQRVFLGNDAININEIAARSNRKSATLSISPSSSALMKMSLGAFATVMDAVKSSGITNVSIVTQPLDAHGSKR